MYGTIFLIRRWDFILPGWRWSYKLQVGVSIPCWAVSTLGTTVFVPGLLELKMYGRISDPEMITH